MGAFTIARKIFACLSILIAGYLGAMIFDYVYDTHIETKLNQISEYRFPAAQKSQAVNMAFKTQTGNYTNAVVFGDEEALKANVKNEKFVEETLEEIRILSKNQGMNEKSLDDVITKIRQFIKDARLIYGKMVNAEDIPDELSEKAIKLRKVEKELISRLDTLAHDYSATLKQELILLNQLSIKLRVLRVVIFLCVVFCSLVLVFFIVNRSVSRPLNEAVKKIQEISNGNFSIRFNLQSRDEVGMVGKALDNMAENMEKRAIIAQEIADGNLTSKADVVSSHDHFGKAFQVMVDSLNNIVGELNDSASQVASGALQIAESSNTLSAGASRQGAALQEIASSMIEIGIQTKANAENSTMASRLGVEAQAIAKSGVSKMDEMASSMNAISESSGKISKIINTIDSIAFQTNLLALNAAVEAARAGKHGKGFAVVAQEVRNLAARSASAAQETTELIDDSLSKIYEGSEATITTVSVLKDIEEGVTKVSDIVKEIAAASNEQAQSIAMVNQWLDKIAEVTQQNTASAEETSAASEELSAQAGYVRKIVGRFRLKKM